MELLLGLMIGMLGLMVGEVVIVVWFIIRYANLVQGKTDFRIPMFVPIIYIVYMIPICMIIFSLDHGLFFEGDFIPVAVRLSNALRAFAMVNATTPLFPLLWWLRKRKIKLMQEVTKEEVSKVTA